MPLISRPIGTPVSRSSRSKRCVRCGLPLRESSVAILSKSAPVVMTWMSISQGCGPILGFSISLDGVCGLQRVVVFRQRDDQGFGLRIISIDEYQVAGFPAEDRLREGRNVGDLGNRLVVGIARQAGQELLLLGGDVAVHIRLGRRQAPGSKRPDQPAERSRSIPDGRFFPGPSC